MTTEFTPLNDLERRLVAAQEGKIPPGAFAEILASSRVFMPLQEHRPTSTQGVPQPAQPLKILGEDGGEVLVLFTSPERAKGFVADYPGYDAGLMTELSGILERLGGRFAISLNPGDSYGLDFEARDLPHAGRRVRPH